MKAPSLHIERAAVRGVWRHKRVWLGHLVANALLFFLTYQWFRIEDRTTLNLVTTALLGIWIVVTALSLHMTTLEFFRRVHRGEDPGFRRTAFGGLVRLPAFLLWSAALVGTWYAISVWRENGQIDFAIQLGAWLTLQLQRPVRPDAVNRFVGYVLNFAVLVLLPLLLVPVGSACAEHGFRGLIARGWKELWSVVKHDRYWFQFFAVALLGLWLPYQLVFWFEASGSVAVQAVSAALRLGLAYFLMVTSWLFTASLVGRWAAEPSRPKS